MEKLLAHAAGAASRIGHGSMMVEGELMSFHKPMSPWSGQEVTHYNKQDSRLPLPLPDPYGSEPPRPDHRHLITRTDCPFTAEPNNVQLLQAGLITPTNLFYIRDHLPAPHLAAAEYSLTVEGPGVDAGSLEKHLRVQSPQPVSAGARGTVSSSSSSKPGRVTLTLQDLAEGFQHHSIVATLQCAGNRRNDMRRLKEVKGGPWEAGAIGTALWTGPWLREVLAAAGVDTSGLVAAEHHRQQLQQQQWAQATTRELGLGQQGWGGVTAVVRSAAEAAAGAGAGAAAAGLEAAARAVAGVSDLDAAVAAVAPAGDGTAADADDDAAAFASVPDVRHVWFEGYDNAGPDTHFLVSIPILDALSESSDVLLALQMNGDALPRYHGYPVRVVVPGHVGVRSVKWLKRIVLSDQEAPSHWQQSDYKMLPPFMDSQLKADWAAVPALQILPVQSAICVPATGEVCEVGGDGCVEVRGYAWSGGGVGVIRVEVTADGGSSWTPAQLQGLEQLGKGAGNGGLLKGGVGKVVGSVSGRQACSGRAWAWTVWCARVPVKTGFAKAAAAVMGQTTVSKAVVGDSRSSSSSSKGRKQQQEEEQGKLQAVIQQKQDKQQQEQQGSAAADAERSAANTGDGPQSSESCHKGQPAAAAAAANDAREVSGVPAGRQVVRLSVKATDARYNSQPSEVGSIWNIRGVGTNSWHSVEVYV